MSQIKAYKPEVAVLVGIQASLLLQHIKYWADTYKLDKVYRTNKQISDDFKGTLSESQVQRAKKKLLDSGLVIISHDKGHTRTTHYKITEKALSLLGSVVEAVKKALSPKKPKETKQPEKVVSNKPKSMSDCFNEQGSTKHAVGMPDSVKGLLSGLFKSKPTENDVVCTNGNEDDDIDSDEHFKALDESLRICSENAKEEQNLTMSDIMNKAFSRVPNLDAFEENRKSLEYASQFKEDY